MKPVRPSDLCGVRRAWKNGSSAVTFVSLMTGNYRETMQKPKRKTAAPIPTGNSTPRRRSGAGRSRSRYTPAEVHEIFRRFSVQRPEPEGELEHVNSFTLPVAVVWSARATDAGGNKASRALFAIADTPRKTLALGEEKIGEYIRTIGVWRNKAKNVAALSEAL